MKRKLLGTPENKNLKFGKYFWLLEFPNTLWWQNVSSLNVGVLVIRICMGIQEITNIT